MSQEIHLPSPCSQNPRNFTRTGMGGFCQSCQKEVIDFRQMNQKEVLDFIRKNPKNTCGVFLKNQVKMAISKRENKKLGSLWVLSLMGILGITIPSFSQKTSQPNQEQNIKVGDSILNGKPTLLMKKIKGKIYSEQDKGELPGVTILIKGTKIGTVTNLNGEFELIIPDSFSVRKIKLVISFVGFSTQEKKIILKENSINIGSIYLHEDQSVLGPFGLVNPRKSVWNQVVGYFKKEDLDAKS
jgi:hypothetical protein